MANIDVKLGIKHILDRIEHAYLKRNAVRRETLKTMPCFDHFQSADACNHLILLTLGHCHTKAIIGGCE